MNEKYYQIRRNFNFLEEYIRYEAVNFNVH